MKKDDYKTEFEEHRKEIQVEDENRIMPSRSEIHRKKRKPKKQSNHALINLFLVLFTLIPIGIFIYVVSDFYKPDQDEPVVLENENVLFETTTGNDNAIQPTNSDVKVTDEKENKEDETVGQQIKPEEQQNPTSNEVKQEQEKTPPPVEKKPEEKKPVPPTVEKKPEEKADTKPVEEKKPVTRTHKVAANETLYRISLKYYGSDAGVEKIKQANGLRSNNIQVGQTLIIP